jgi:DUF1680 family protein
METLTRNRGLVVTLAVIAFSTGTAFQRITPAVPSVARPLPLSAVRLTGGPLAHAQQLDAKYLLALEPDSMLAYYRQRAGLEPKAQPYGGWDGDKRNLTGHIAGHYLSAVSLMWAATGDVRLKQRADYIVDQLQEVQDQQGDGYLGALAGGREAFAEVSKGNIRSASFDLNGLWSPWYVLHKTYAGLRDAYRYTGNVKALQIEIKYAEWAERVLAPLSEEQTQKMLNTEFGGMNEVLADLYADTGDRRWLALSYRFEHHAVVDPLKRQEDPLSGLHGNTQVPKLLGSAVRFADTGDRGDGTAARFFWDRVAHHHSFATGGHGKDEYFRDPDELSKIVDGRTAETCNVYNMNKFSRLLFSLEPNIEYADFIERALFNHILGSIDPDDGSMCYMVPVGRGVQREYQNMFRSFTCCVGTGMESHALHGLGLYYESGDRLWVNIYAPSAAEWNAAGMKLQMETTFPEGDSASMKLTMASPKAFTIALRRPWWAGDGFNVKVNDKDAPALSKPGAYVELKRTWKTGDTISLVLPKALRVEALADNPRRAALMWGPLVLAGDLGPAVDRGRGGRPAAPNVPVLVAAEQPIATWLKAVDDKPGTFRSNGVGRDRDVEFVPFYRLHRRTYAAYWDLYTPAEWEKRTSEIAAEREHQRQLEAATVAFVQPGEPQIERDFNQQGEETSRVDVEGRPGRRGAKWFSYDVPVDASQPMTLVVTYHSDNRRPRTFNIFVDSTRVGEQTVPQSAVARFFDVEYRIPADVVRGKDKVTVKFEATNGNEIAAVFGVRTIRPITK